MKAPILRTKLQRPSVSHDFIPRERLVKRLEQGRKLPLTLISAPAGYGKSTLTSNWMASRDYAHAWVSLDKSDNDLHQFLSYLLASIRQLYHKVILRSETLLESNRTLPIDEVAAYLLNDLQQLPDPFILVLDDYHHITEQQVNDLVAELLQHPARTMHLILLTRQDPPLPIASMRGRGVLKEIRASELRFTPGETAAFLSRVVDSAVDEATAALLEAKTEGWAVGLRLAGLYLQGQNDLKLPITQLDGSSMHIAEYLMAEVLSRQNPEILSYLLETSVLDRFCAPLTRLMHFTVDQKQEEIAEVSAEQFIQWLLDTNLFIIALDNKRGWFRYHHLFRDFLNGVLHTQRTADQIAELHRTAGAWFAENDLIEEAIKHFIFAGDTSAAVQLIVDRRYELLNATKIVRLDHWLRLMPEQVVEQNLLLVCLQAHIAIMSGNFADFKYYTEKAVEVMVALSPESDIYCVLKGEVLVLQSLVIMLGGDAPRGLAHATESMGYLQEDALLIRSLGIGVSAGCHQMMGNCCHARALIKEAMSNRMLPTNIQARLCYYLCVVSYLEGDLTGAMKGSMESLRCLKDSPFAHTRALANYFLGVGHYLRNEREMVEPFLMAVWEDRHACNPSYVVQAILVLVCMYLLQDDEIAADQMLHKTIVYCGEVNQEPILALIQPVKAEIALRRGDLQQVQQICKQADFDVYTLPWLYYLPKLTPIKLMLAENTEQSLRQARGLLSALDDQMRRIHRTSARIEVLALIAVACHRQNDQADAFSHLQKALKLAEPGGWIRAFVDLGDAMTDLLTLFTRQQAGHAFAGEVLAAAQAEHENWVVTKLAKASEKLPGETAIVTVLTQRETEMLPMLAEGLSNKEIAAKLHIAPVTVKTHLQNIYKKLKTRNRTETVKRTRELGFTLDN